MVLPRQHGGAAVAGTLAEHTPSGVAPLSCALYAQKSRKGQGASCGVICAVNQELLFMHSLHASQPQRDLPKDVIVFLLQLARVGF